MANKLGHFFIMLIWKAALRTSFPASSLRWPGEASAELALRNLHGGQVRCPGLLRPSRALFEPIIMRKRKELSICCIQYRSDTPCHALIRPVFEGIEGAYMRPYMRHYC